MRINLSKQAIEKANLHVLHLDCLKFFCDLMQQIMRETESFYSQTELQHKHEDAMRQSLSMVWHLNTFSPPSTYFKTYLIHYLQFEDHKKRGGTELIQSFKNKLEHDIVENFQRFQQENESKRKFAEVSRSLCYPICQSRNMKTNLF